MNVIKDVIWNLNGAKKEIAYEARNDKSQATQQERAKTCPLVVGLGHRT